jgi:hypothetical protein
LALVVLANGVLANGVLANDTGPKAPIPLDPAVAEVLDLLGQGVVGKPLPPVALDEIEAYLNFGPGEWHYQNRAPLTSSTGSRETRQRNAWPLEA